MELEEMAGTAREIALSYSSPEVLQTEFKPLYEKLQLSVGRFGRYPDLAKSIRELNHCCAVAVYQKVKGGDLREWQEDIQQAFQEFIHQCDLVTKRSPKTRRTFLLRLRSGSPNRRTAQTKM